VPATVAANLYARCGAAPDIMSSRPAAEECLEMMLKRLDAAALERAHDLAVRMPLEQAGAYALAVGASTGVIDTAAQS
jgi:hypothetical protein